jgi:hypothetical protein
MLVHLDTDAAYAPAFFVGFSCLLGWLRSALESVQFENDSDITARKSYLCWGFLSLLLFLTILFAYPHLWTGVKFLFSLFVFVFLVSASRPLLYLPSPIVFLSLTRSPLTP